MSTSAPFAVEASCGWFNATQCGEVCRIVPEPGTRPTIELNATSTDSSTSRINSDRVNAQVGDRIVVFGTTHNTLSTPDHDTVAWLSFSGPSFTKLDQQESQQRVASVWVSDVVSADFTNRVLRLTASAVANDLQLRAVVVRPEDGADLLYEVMIGNSSTGTTSLTIDYSSGEDNRLGLGTFITSRVTITNHLGQTAVSPNLSGANSGTMMSSKDIGQGASSMGWSTSSSHNAAAVGVVLRSELPIDVEFCRQVHRCTLESFPNWPTDKVLHFDSGHPLIPDTCYLVDDSPTSRNCDLPAIADPDDLLTDCDADECVYATACPTLDGTFAVDISIPWSVSTGGNFGCPDPLEGTVRLHGTVTFVSGTLTDDSIDIQVTHNGCECNDCDSGNCDEDYSESFNGLSIECIVIDGIAHWRVEASIDPNIFPSVTTCVALNFMPTSCAGIIVWNAPITKGDDSPAGNTLDLDTGDPEYDFFCSGSPSLVPPSTVAIT